MREKLYKTLGTSIFYSLKSLSSMLDFKRNTILKQNNFFVIWWPFFLLNFSKEWWWNSFSLSSHQLDLNFIGTTYFLGGGREHWTGNFTGFHSFLICCFLLNLNWAKTFLIIILIYKREILLIIIRSTSIYKPLSYHPRSLTYL